ncbi:hypothetical protein B0J11DRAFT_510678 [Dendryphion nanum]|uniref:RING-type domain-containing protein n=1 Tax=Dendryphion nanum TaxID=256645 RepID=A0A9P9D9D0_9PLEO|nr:hypothetical protein B0J11DRAFT_510678 [Dendryphion nanum]
MRFFSSTKTLPSYSAFVPIHLTPVTPPQSDSFCAMCILPPRPPSGALRSGSPFVFDYANVVQTPCGHMFHWTCLSIAVAFHNSCPECLQILYLDAESPRSSSFDEMRVLCAEIEELRKRHPPVEQHPEWKLALIVRRAQIFRREHEEQSEASRFHEELLRAEVDDRREKRLQKLAGGGTKRKKRDVLLKPWRSVKSAWAWGIAKMKKR